MFSFTVTSQGQLLDNLKRRREAAEATALVVSRLVVPPSLEFWYWQEFGTAAYSIAPVESSQLVFPDGGRVSHPVDHPGLRPRRMITTVLDDIRRSARDLISPLYQTGEPINPSDLQEAVTAALLAAKALIVASITTNLPGTRPANPEYPKQGGKLEGQSAAEVFDAEATVVEGTE